MPVKADSHAAGMGSFHVHRGHAFEGFELRTDVLAALCSCGALLDCATAVFAACTECEGSGQPCLRCGGSGAIVDHAALEWRLTATR